MNRIKIKYDTSALVLPGKVVDIMDRASLTDLKVLLALCASPELCSNYQSDRGSHCIAELAGCDTDGVGAALAFWRGAGLIAIEEIADIGTDTHHISPTPVKEPIPVAEDGQQTSKAPETEKKGATKLRPKDELPHYTTEQLSAFLESHKETADWLHECQRVFGKMFNTHEVNTILGFVDYLGLDWEYVLCLLAYYVSTRERRGLPKSIKGTETMAYDFYNRDIQTLAALQEEIRRLELYAETEGKLRALFGMGERSLTPKEKKCFSTWLYDFGFGVDIIRLAYDVTVDAKGAPNISYMNSVLSNWNRDGLRTEEAIRGADEAHRAAAENRRSGKKNGVTVPTTEGSFDTDDFFAAAVRRSFGDEDPADEGKK